MKSLKLRSVTRTRYLIIRHRTAHLNPRKRSAIPAQNLRTGLICWRVGWVDQLVVKLRSCNALQVIDVYRTKLQDGLSGLEGNDVARQRIEAYVNTIRPRHSLVSQ